MAPQSIEAFKEKSPLTVFINEMQFEEGKKKNLFIALYFNNTNHLE